VPPAEEIVEQEIRRFAEWLGQLDVRPTIAAPRTRREHPSSRCSKRTRDAGTRTSARDLARVEALARAVMGRLLHEPTIRLKSLDSERSHGSIELLRDLFALRGADRGRER